MHMCMNCKSGFIAISKYEVICPDCLDLPDGVDIYVRCMEEAMEGARAYREVLPLIIAEQAAEDNPSDPVAQAELERQIVLHKAHRANKKKQREV